MMFLSLLLLLVSAGLAVPPGAATPETAAERLHRRGVFCMDEIERPSCAIEKFEALLAERTTQRELVTDGMLRLVKLYQSGGEADRVKSMLRQFWRAGVKRRQTGHVPYSTRHLPDEMDMLVMIDVADILDAPISNQMGPDAKRWITTCDPGERQLLGERRRWKRAEKKALQQGKETIEVIYAEMDRTRAMRQRTQPDDSDQDEDFDDPVFGDALCPLAEALGETGIRGWNRMLGAMSHQDFRISAGIVEIRDLAPRLQAAEAAGRLLPRGERRWALPGLDYYGHEVHVANLDLDELVVARDDVITKIRRSRKQQRKTMARSLDKLVGEIPRDVEFFFVMTEQAVLELGMGGMTAGQRGVFAALLPRPKGFQMSAIAHDYFGVFMRMPSDNAVKGALLISLAQRLLTEDEEMDEDQRELMRNIDLSQSSDKRALLMSYVLSPAQVRRIFFY